MSWDATGDSATGLRDLLHMTCTTLWKSQTFLLISMCLSHWKVSVCCQCTCIKVHWFPWAQLLFVMYAKKVERESSWDWTHGHLLSAAWPERNVSICLHPTVMLLQQIPVCLSIAIIAIAGRQTIFLALLWVTLWFYCNKLGNILPNYSYFSQ